MLGISLGLPVPCRALSTYQRALGPSPLFGSNFREERYYLSCYIAYTVWTIAKFSVTKIPSISCYRSLLPISKVAKYDGCLARGEFFF